MIHINEVIRAVVLVDKGVKQNTMDSTNFPVKGPKTRYNSNFAWDLPKLTVSPMHYFNFEIDEQYITVGIVGFQEDCLM